MSTENPDSTSTTPGPQSSPYTIPLLTTIVVGTPILLALPPRKLDLYTFSLTTAWGYSAQQLYSHKYPSAISSSSVRTGSTGVMGELGSAQIDPPQTEAETRLRPGLGSDSTERKGEVGGDEGEDNRGWLRRMWMGGEKEGWQKRRLEKEREELEAGKGYGDIIMDQVREVFGGRKGEDEGGE
ncbi:hypothetical protein ACLMJK_009492 [Lecanora helva]